MKKLLFIPLMALGLFATTSCIKDPINTIDPYNDYDAEYVRKTENPTWDCTEKGNEVTWEYIYGGSPYSIVFTFNDEDELVKTVETYILPNSELAHLYHNEIEGANEFAEVKGNKLILTRTGNDIEFDYNKAQAKAYGDYLAENFNNGIGQEIAYLIKDVKYTDNGNSVILEYKTADATTTETYTFNGGGECVGQVVVNNYRTEVTARYYYEMTYGGDKREKTTISGKTVTYTYPEYSYDCSSKLEVEYKKQTYEAMQGN